MTDEAAPAFSPECVSMLLQDAERAGLKGATAITVALRNQLTLMKDSGAVPDNRTQTYFLAARTIKAGISEPLEGVADVVGLAACNGIAADIICDAFGYARSEAPDDLVETQLKSARVNLSRKGEAHLQVQVDATNWLDLYVFTIEGNAASRAATLEAGKVF